MPNKQRIAQKVPLMFKLIMILSYGVMLVIGFVLGVYLLPILTAPKSPDAAALAASSQGAMFTTEFIRNLKGSNFFIGERAI